MFHFRGASNFILSVALASLAAGCSSVGKRHKDVSSSDRSLPPLKSSLSPVEQEALALDLAELYIKFGLLDKAKPLLDKVRRTEPYSPRLLRLYGLYYATAHQPQLALTALKVLRAKHGLTHEDEAFMAKLALQSHDYALSEHIYRQWIKTCKGIRCAQAWNNLGVVLLAQGKYKEAKAAFIQAIRHDPLDVKAKNNLTAVIELDTMPAEKNKKDSNDGNINREKPHE